VSGPARAGTTAPIASVEARIARLLTFGTRLAVAFLAAGSLLLIAGGTSPLAGDWPPLQVAALPSQLLDLVPAGFLWTGILVTIATPFLRVLAATAGFAAAGERRMVALGVALLAVIGVAVAAGMAGA
jgi:uncharacterized membrane protein